MKKLFVLLAVAAFLLPVAMVSAQTESAPYRTKGYHGNVSAYSEMIVLGGIETSHGYMFNANNYLGLCIGAKFPFTTGLLESSLITIALDYKAYLTDKNVAPLIELKVGTYIGGDDVGPGLLVNPGIGVSWAFNERMALNVTVGMDIIGLSSLYEDFELAYLPMLKIGFDF